MCLLVLLLGFVAPFLNADYFRESIRRELEAALNRPVEMGNIRFSLFRGLGFSAEDVLIGDDPGAGIEPFAHVATMRVRLQPFKTLWRRKLVFSTLSLIDPSVNLVKTEGGGWNFRSFFQGAGSGAGQHKPHTSFPDIEVSGARLDFKFGLLKSVFYINNADVDIYPNSDGALVVRFSGEPARTDRTAQSFGRLSARGLLRNNGKGEDELNMLVQLERSSLSELARLVSGGDIGVHGYVASSATLDGPLSRIQISGDLILSDLHRWDLMPAQGDAWRLKYTGTFNVPAQQLALETVSEPGQPTPVMLKFDASNVISAPKWVASIALHDLPAASLVQTARHMGAALPANVQVDGKVNGGITVSGPHGFEGELQFGDVALTIPNAGSAHVDSARLMVANGKMSLAPAEITLADGSTATVEGAYSAADQDFWTDITARGLAISDLKTGPAKVIDASAIPFVTNCRHGVWTGQARYEQKGDEPGRWSGGFVVQNADLDVPGLASPLHVGAATVEVDGDKIQVKNLRGRAGAIAVAADFRYGPDDAVQHLRLAIAEADVAQIERLFLPTLRRSQGLLANLRLRRAVIPEWLADRNIQGTVQIKSLTNGDAPVCAFGARLNWTAAVVQLSNVTCTQADMQASGRIALNLAGAQPRYKIAAHVENLDYKTGTLDLDGDFETTGTGSDFLVNTASTGTFDASDVRLGPDAAFREISGAYQITPGSVAPHLVLSKVQASDGVDNLAGQGSTQADGRLVLELAAGKRQVHLVENLLPLRAPAQ